MWLPISPLLPLFWIFVTLDGSLAVYGQKLLSHTDLIKYFQNEIISKVKDYISLITKEKLELVSLSFSQDPSGSDWSLLTPKKAFVPDLIFLDFLIIVHDVLLMLYNAGKGG